MKQQVIYKIINLINNKFYVGSTTNMYERTRGHKSRLRRNKHHAKHLQAAWNLYGADKFVFVVVEVIADGESLQEAENKWLHEWVGNDMCYNKSLYSDTPMRGIAKEDHPSYGRTKTEKEKQLISDTLKEGYASGEYPHPRVGKKHTEETRKKIIAAKAASTKNKGENHYRYGKTVSEEVRKKIGDTQRGVKKPAGRKVSPEGKLKIQESIAAGRWSKGLPPNPIEEVLAKFPQEVLHKYDFTAAVYTGALNRIEGCICSAHGVFSQYAAQFRKGRGCPSCGAEKRAESKRKQMKECWASGEGKALFRNAK